ncbi:pilus assembly protein TadG-related protein [Roseibium sp. MB-4]
MIKALISKLNRNQDGSILPIFGAMVLVLVVIGGAAIDISRAVNAREKLAYAIDAAALSVATDLSTSALSDAQIKTRIENSFRANLGDAEFLDQAIENLSFVIDDDEGTVTVTSAASLNNYFIDIGGFGKEALGPDAFNFGTSAEVNYSRFDVELALIVDVTGSMSGDMATLREASQAVVDILLPEDLEKEEAKVRISLVPYSQGVNLGSYASKVMGGEYYPVAGYCVTEREDYGPYRVRYTDAAYNYYIDANPPPRETFFGDGGNYGSTNRCPASSQLIPLTNDRDLLTPAIAALQATGGTAGQTGAIWGWNTLSPNFANVWPTESVAATYTNTEVLKFAIMMTDGDNNRHFYQTDQRCNWYTCWNYDPKVWVETGSGSGGYNGTSSQRHREYCDKMKDAGITVFGVYFGNNSNSVGARNMQSCASPESYYQASSRDGLIQAFSNIAKKVQNIYLSK